MLINNAGVAGGWPEAPTTLTPEEVRRVVETNVIGVIRLATLPDDGPTGGLFDDTGIVPW